MSSLMLFDLMFSAAPTTCTLHGMVSALTLMHWPMASLFGQSVFAIASLTTIARGSASDDRYPVIARPRSYLWCRG